MDVAFDDAALRCSAVSWVAHNWVNQDIRNVLAVLGCEAWPDAGLTNVPLPRRK